MTLQEVANLGHAEYGNRYQISPAQFLRYFNIVQTLAYDKDLEAFKDYSNVLTILQQFNVETYTVAPIASDVGKEVVGTSSGATGTLRYYENGSRTIVAVELDDEDAPFEDGEDFTITSGTGAGTFESADAQETYKGPYDFPTSPLLRKLVGITKLTDAQLYQTPASIDTADDYGLKLTVDYNRMWEKIRVSVRGTTRTITFIDEPAPESVYRWVYYIRPPVITSFTNDTNFWLPLESHWTTFYQGVIALADNATYGDKQPAELLEPYFKPFWDSVRPLNTPMGGLYDYGISEGQPI